MSTIASQQKVSLITETVTSLVVAEENAVSLVETGNGNSIVTVEEKIALVTETETQRIVEQVEKVLLVEGGTKGVPGDSWEETFETFSKNVNAYPYTLQYTGEQLTSITYDLGIENVVKTFGYEDGQLITITLSGGIPETIPTTKTLHYTGEQLTSVTYS